MSKAVGPLSHGETARAAAGSGGRGVRSQTFHGTTTRDIASAAGMSPAAVHVHHRSKEAGAQHAEGNIWTGIAHYELAALSAQHLDGVCALRIGIGSEVRRVVETGVASGEFDVPVIGMATTAVLSLGVDVARGYRKGNRWGPEDIGEHVAELALRIVGVRVPPT